MPPNLPTETKGIITPRDIQRRLRQLECSRHGCACHTTARQGHGQTHCPLHALDAATDLIVNLAPDYALSFECGRGCEQVRLIPALFGKVIIAWEKARWEGVIEASKPQRSPERRSVELP